MPVRVGAGDGDVARCSGIADSSSPTKLGAAIVLRAQTKASAQSCPADALWSTPAGVAGRCSGISQACSAGRSERSAHAADPTRGCSWNNRSRAAKMDFMALTLWGAILQGKRLQLEWS